MDVRKLTADAFVHTAQHERLPLRVIVRSSICFQTPGNNSARDPLCSPMNRDEGYETTAGDSCQATLKNQMSHLRIKDEELHKNGKLSKKNSKNNKTDIQLLPSRSRRIFDKLWSV
ncbi:BTB/POZ domain-containing protein NPY1 [Glycine soja]|uniref:BTB/POZ domain-containing protein NPY1 n=1 Tax=Glycine soja TaxID=3848 RepID=A0A445L979_GLYSO|nr:BTB/POZ domain-containing protein NPY1 [Glycine soja]